MPLTTALSRYASMRSFCLDGMPGEFYTLYHVQSVNVIGRKEDEGGVGVQTTTLHARVNPLSNNIVNG